MTYATDTTIPSRWASWRVIAAALSTAAVIAVTAVVVQTTNDDTLATTGPADPPATAIVTAPQELSAYARSQGLTGLSPASLSLGRSAALAPSEAMAVYQTYRDVARYAHANGLSGLSPASLAPLARRTTR
jgi:hypothetical protein